MGYVLYALNLFLVAAVLCGIMLFLHDKAHIDPSFLPLLSVSLITLSVYFGGLLGCLASVTVLVYLFGLAAAFYEGIRILRRKYSPNDFFASPAVWLFAVFCIYFIVRMKGMQVLHVDNFSHWAVIIKEMCLTDAFPVEGTAVTFRNYIPGSASFIYFVCKAVAFSEGHALMAQGIITSAALATLFCRVKFRNIAYILSLLSVSVLAVSVLELLSASLGIYNFLVDDLLAYVTIAAGIVIYAYRRDFKKCLMVLIPVMGMLVIIKSSARIFAALVTILVIIVFFKEIFSLKKFVGLGSLVAVQFLLPTVYNRYIEHTFPNHTDKFSSDMGSLFSSFVSKDPAYLKNIASKMMAEITDFSSTSVRLILVAELFALVACVISLMLKKKPRMALSALICANLTLIFYVGELFVLYGFIFNEYEAEMLASFYRYFATGTILVVLTLFPASIYQLQYIAGEHHGKQIIPIAASVVALVFSFAPLYAVRESAVQLIDPHCRQSTAIRQQERDRFNSFYSAVSPHVPADSSVFVYTENTSFFAASLPVYGLMTSHYGMMYPTDFEDMEAVKERLGKREYIVVDGNLGLFREKICSVEYTLVGGDAAVYQIDADAKTLTAIGN